MRFLFTFVVLSGIGAVSAFAQSAKPAPVIEIFRETIKEGRGAAHEKVETDYAAIFRKANHPAHYVAMATVSGPQEVWFLQPMPSFAISEDYDKASEKEPLKSTIAMMDSRDGELRASSRTMWAVFRPDLSYGVDKFIPGKSRFVMVGTFHVRMGHDEDFAAGGKQYLAAFAKAGIDECTLAYQVVAGASGGTYLFFTMMESMKFLDGYPARMQAIQQAMGAEDYSRFMKGGGDVIASIDDTILQVKPGMSYPTQDMVDGDPAFWKPKPVAAKPASAAAPAAPEKKAAAQ
jgi:hypothetical protein